MCPIDHHQHRGSYVFLPFPNPPRSSEKRGPHNGIDLGNVQIEFAAHLVNMTLKLKSRQEQGGGGGCSEAGERNGAMAELGNYCVSTSRRPCKKGHVACLFNSYLNVSMDNRPGQLCEHDDAKLGAAGNSLESRHS